jgi:antitoxin MazE
MQIKLQKWGNSLGIRIPSSIINELKLKENDLLNAAIKENKIVIDKNSHKSIYELFEGYSGDYVCEEFEPYNESDKELW